MSVPGRIGIILIAALAIVDAFILASGARNAASAIETHAVIESMSMQTDFSDRETASHEPLLSTALKQINLWIARPADKPTGI